MCGNRFVLFLTPKSIGLSKTLESLNYGRAEGVSWRTETRQVFLGRQKQPDYLSYIQFLKFWLTEIKVSKIKENNTKA